MNKKEELLDMLTNLTKDKVIKWTISSGSELNSIVPNANTIIRAFSTEHFGSIFFLVEQKLLVYHPDLENYYENVRRDVYVISKGVLQMVINQEEISEQIMADFCQVIEEKNNNTSIDSLFNIFFSERKE